MKKILISGVLIVLVAPQIALASWWNPISWFRKQPTQTAAQEQSIKTVTSTASEIENLQKRIDELKKQQPVAAPITTTSAVKKKLGKVAPVQNPAKDFQEKGVNLISNVTTLATTTQDGVSKNVTDITQTQTPEQKAYWDKWSIITKDIDNGLLFQKTALDLVASGAVKTSGLHIQKSLKALNESLELLKAGYIPENRRSHLHLITSVEFLILASEELQKNYELGEKSQHYDKAVDYIDQYMYYRTLSNDNLKRF